MTAILNEDSNMNACRERERKEKGKRKEEERWWGNTFENTHTYTPCTHIHTRTHTPLFRPFLLVSVPFC